MGYYFSFIVLVLFQCILPRVFSTDKLQSVARLQRQTDLVLIEVLQARDDESDLRFIIDSTVSYVVVEIENVRREQNCTLKDPNDSILLATDDNESSGIKKRASERTPNVGEWTVVCSGEQTYTVFVWGLSDVTFQIQFMDVSDNPTDGDPIQDSNVTLGVEVSGSEDLQLVSNVEIICLNGFADIYNVSKLGAGRQHNFYEVVITVPDQAFRVGLIARDKKNNTVHRQSSVIRPKTYTVSVSQITKDTSPGSNVVFLYSLYNNIDRNQTFNVRVILDSFNPNEFASNATTGSEVQIPAFTKQYGAFDVIISPRSAIGSSCDVTLSVEGTNHSVEFIKVSLVVQPSNISPSSKSDVMTSPDGISRKSTPTSFITQKMTSYQSTMVTVSNDTVVTTTSFASVTTISQWTGDRTRSTIGSSPEADVSPPAFSKLSFIDRCYKNVRCSIGEWVVVFMIQDNESGVHRVMAEDTIHSFVHTENFTDGLANVPIHGNISTSCCQNEAVLIAEDVMGNKGRYNLTYEGHQISTGNGTDTDTSATTHQLKDLAAIVVGFCAGILALIIVLTVIIQFKSNIVSIIAKIKFPHSVKEVELRVPYKLSINPGAKE
ncbi:uncharacterized protein LOC133191273 [Saccostrea echinata]|uniref:uncharacterized protein LOC133191273 n=1 Tax=Saccostrea echinata TaxID=191078 RepID=UPI002A83788E|nr:uncharacterized protein LOC133191273 [Saccostrea echinata]